MGVQVQFTPRIKITYLLLASLALPKSLLEEALSQTVKPEGQADTRKVDVMCIIFEL